MLYSFAWLGSGNQAQRITDTDRVLELWWTAFLQQYRAGGYLHVCLHPFVSGRAQRIDMLDPLITRMTSLTGVWFHTCEQVALPRLQVCAILALSATHVQPTAAGVVFHLVVGYRCVQEVVSLHGWLFLR